MNVDQESATAFKEFTGDCLVPVRVFFAYLYAAWSLAGKEAFEAGGSRNPKIRDAARQKLKALCMSEPAVTVYAPESVSYGYDEAKRVLWFPRSAPLRGIDRLFLRPERALYAEHLRPFFNKHENEEIFDLRNLDQIDRDNLAAIAGEQLEQIANLGRVLFGGKQGGSFSVIQVSSLPDIDPEGVIDRLLTGAGTFVDLRLPTPSRLSAVVDLPTSRSEFDALVLDALCEWYKHAPQPYERIVTLPVFLEPQQDSSEVLAETSCNYKNIDAGVLLAVVMNAPTPTVRAAIDGARASHAIRSDVSVLPVGGEDLKRLVLAFPWVWSKYFSKATCFRVIRASDESALADLLLRSITYDEARAIENEFRAAVDELCTALSADLAAGIRMEANRKYSRPANSAFVAAYERIAAAVFARVRRIDRADISFGCPDPVANVLRRLLADAGNYYNSPYKAPHQLTVQEKMGRELRRLIAKASLPVSREVAPFCVDNASYGIYTQRRHIAVFGAAGCGKSTTLWYLLSKSSDVVLAFGCGKGVTMTRICDQRALADARTLVEDLADRGLDVTVVLERLELEAGRAATDTTLAALLDVTAGVNARVNRDAVRVLTSVEVPAPRAFKDTYRPLLQMMGFVSMETIDAYFVAEFVEYAASALEIFVADEARHALHHAPRRADDPTPAGDFSSDNRRGKRGLGEIVAHLRFSECDRIAPDKILEFFDEDATTAMLRQRRIEEI